MPYKLMVVDDDAGIAEVIALVARSIGLDVRSVTNPFDVVDRYLDYRPDILMLDMIMPGKDGIAVLHEVLRMETPPRIIVTTGYSESYTRLAAGVAKFHAATAPVVLTKPFRRAQLIDALTTVINVMPPSQGTGLTPHAA
ncbi:MAG TPA: response regulator [Acetobacteraceae bacterium]|nr:response regulator [Acetobacteraceae bacterium]